MQLGLMTPLATQGYQGDGGGAAASLRPLVRTCPTYWPSNVTKGARLYPDMFFSISLLCSSLELWWNQDNF